MFSEIFFLCKETVLGCNSQNMSKLRQINGISRELNVCTPSADFHYCLLLGCLSFHWYFNLTFSPFEPYFWYFKWYIHLLHFLGTFEAFYYQIQEVTFFSAFGQTLSPPTLGLGSTFCHLLGSCFFQAIVHIPFVPLPWPWANGKSHGTAVQTGQLLCRVYCALLSLIFITNFLVF